MDTKSRRITMIGVFVAITIIGFFFSPLGDKMELAAQQMFELNEMGIVEKLLSKVMLAGIWDYLQVFAFIVSGALIEGVDGFLCFFPGPFIVFAFVGVQLLINYIYDEYIKDDSEILGNIFDAFLLENIFGFFFSIIVMFILNVTTKIALGIQSSNEGVAGLLGILSYFMLLLAVLFIGFYFFIYILCIMAPIGIGALLMYIPIIGSILSLIAIVILEVIFLFYLWREYISNWAFKVSLWVAKLPFLIIGKFRP